MNSLRRVLFLLALSLPLASHAGPVTIIDNTADTASLVIDVINQQGIAQAFTTDNQLYRLASVSVRLALPGNGSETVEVQLRADDDKKNLPGAILETWQNVAVTGSTAQDLVSTSIGTGLMPNTRYWLVVRAVSGGQVNWSITTDATQTGVGTIGGIAVTEKAGAAAPIWKTPAGATGAPIFSVKGSPVPPALFVSYGSDPPQITSFDPTTSPATQIDSFDAFDPSFQGGVRLATADFDGDGIPDIVAGAGAGASAVKVFRGSDHSLLYNFLAFDPSFTGGIFVAAGDVNGDGFPDIIVGPDVTPGSNPTSGPPVKVFSGKPSDKLKVLRSFFAFAPTFTGGVRVASADLNGDGCDDIICGAGYGGGPHVIAFSGKDGKTLASFFAFDPSFNHGIFVAAGDVDGNGSVDIVAATGNTFTTAVPPRVTAFSGPTFESGLSFTPASSTDFGGGIHVAVGDIDDNGASQIILGADTGQGPRVQVYATGTATTEQDFYAYPANFHGGVFVAGATSPHPAPLTITASGAGSGKVTSALLKTPLQHPGGTPPDTTTVTSTFLTQQFTLTATPDKSSAFAGWKQGPDIVGFDQTSTFRMSLGLTLEATFIAVPFAGFDGIYNGLIVFDNGSPARGHFQAKLSPTGALNLFLDIGTPQGFTHLALPKTQLLGNGQYQQIIPVKGIGDMRLTFTLDLDPMGTGAITGTLQEVIRGNMTTGLNATFTAQLDAFADGTCPFAGVYTMLLFPPGGTADTFPGGIGSAFVKVDAKGKATFTGMLGDGTRLAASFFTAADRTCTFFFPMYHGLGYLAGTVDFFDQTDSDISGTLSWVKVTGVKSDLYPDGFTGNVGVLGTDYHPTSARLILNPNGDGNLALVAPDSDVKVAGQPTDAPPINTSLPVTLDPDDFLHVPSPSTTPNPFTMKASIKRAKGIFQGTFVDNTIMGKTLTFIFPGYILLPKGNTPGQAGATFIRGTRTGSAAIMP